MFEKIKDHFALVSLICDLKRERDWWRKQSLKSATPLRWELRMERGCEQKVLQFAIINDDKSTTWQDVPEVARPK